MDELTLDSDSDSDDNDEAEDDDDLIIVSQTERPVTRGVAAARGQSCCTHVALSVESPLTRSLKSHKDRLALPGNGRVRPLAPPAGHPMHDPPARFPRQTGIRTGGAPRQDEFFRFSSPEHDARRDRDAEYARQLAQSDAVNQAREQRNLFQAPPFPGDGRALGAAARVGGREGMMQQMAAMMGLPAQLAFAGGGGAGWAGGMGFLTDWYGGGGGGAPTPQGLQGVIGGDGWGGAARVRQSKKWTKSLSYPGGGKTQPGFSRDIIPPPDSDDELPPPPPPKRKKGSSRASAKPKPKPVEMEPACASCLRLLILAQQAEGRKPWVLKCGHVVCGDCLDKAKARVQAERAATRRANWVQVEDGKGGKKGKGRQEVVTLDEEEAELSDTDPDTTSESDLPPPSAVTRSGALTARHKSSTTKFVVEVAKRSIKKAKGKGKAKVDVRGIEEDWTVCPVDLCAGAGGDVLSDNSKDFNGPFRVYV